ncbi:hypothetical protein AHAS_Ahas14G0008200 [Arachis hypogaea]
MQGVQSVNFNILWNGNKTKDFKPGRGVRQGDPISPYLFVICMDYLSQYIEQEVEEKNWSPIRVGRNGPKTSHLMFADDLLLFSEASRDPWVEDINSLLEFATQSISDTESAVWEWTNNKGEWDIGKLKEYLPEDIVAKITASPPPSLDQDENTIGGKHTENGDFSIGATYKALEKWTKPQQNDWTKIWKWQGPQKAKTLMWRLLYDRLLTNQRKAHTFGGDDTCHSCRTYPEDTLHAFRNCLIALSTWMNLIKLVAVQAFF